MYYGALKKTDTANGLGVRVTLFVSGCTNCCEGCFQKETWDFGYGQPYSAKTQIEIIEALEPEHIKGFTVLGGEPFEPTNQQELVRLLRTIKGIYPQKDIWAFTGFLLDKDLVEGGRKHTEFTDEMLSYIDVLVDGPFIQAQRSMMLKYCGSENQRVIDMNETRKQNKIVLFDFDNRQI